MTPNKNLKYYEKSDIAFMSFLMIWEPGSSGIEFFGNFQYYFPGGRRFWTPERTGEVNFHFLSIFVTLKIYIVIINVFFGTTGAKLGVDGFLATSQD